MTHLSFPPVKNTEGPSGALLLSVLGILFYLLLRVFIHIFYHFVYLSNLKFLKFFSFTSFFVSIALKDLCKYIHDP